MKTYEFNGFCISAETRKLARSSGENVPLTPRIFDLLLMLVESESRILTKDEILETVWADCIVDEANLTQSIYVLRTALGESSRDPQFIRTIPSHGYRFICEVKVTDTARTLAETNGTPDHGAKPVLTKDRKSPIMSRRYVVSGLILIAVAAAFAIGGYFGFGGRLTGKSSAIYQQLTFERGTVWTARFTASARAAVYGASLNGRGLDMFTLQLPAPEARRLNMPNTSLLSISSKGEMAILLNQAYIYQFIHRGTLARMPLDGTAYREIAENVQEADWSPDGESLAVVRWTESGNRLEYPIGKVLRETAGYFSYPRISSTGGQIAFFTHESQHDNRGSVSVVDIQGNAITKSDEWSGLEGLAWHGKEVWFTASKNGEAYALYALSPDGTVRNVERAPMNLMLNDIAANNAVLLSRAIQQTDVYLNQQTGPDVDLSWLQLIGIADLSSDGTQFLFTHFGEGSGKNYAVYLRKTDGSAAIRLGDGRALALSPDNRTALAKISDPEGLTLLPTGAGEVKPLPVGNIEHLKRGGWFPDGSKIIFTGNEKGRPQRSFVQDPKDGSIIPITPEGIYGTLLSPDANLLVVNDQRGQKSIFRIGGELVSVKGMEKSDDIIRWDADGKSLFIYSPLDLPIKIYRLDLRSGRKDIVREIQPSYTSGIFGDIYLFLTPDAKVTLYGLRRYLIDLYLVNGLE